MDIDELTVAKAADPMAKAREAKARKAAEKAAAEADKAEIDAASMAASEDGPQPVVSSLQTRSVLLDEGPPIKMRVTYKGHGQISTGGEFGFERYARNAVITAPESCARQLYDKNWAEPLDEGYIAKWETLSVRERALEAKRYKEFEAMLEHGSVRDYNSHDAFGGAAPR